MLEAKKCYGLQIFNYTVTSNHIHLLALDSEETENVIPKSLQLVAGKKAQKYNVGSKAFVENIGRKLKPSWFEKKIKEIDDHYVLREAEATYDVSFGHKNELLSPKNRFYLDLNNE